MPKSTYRLVVSFLMSLSLFSQSKEAYVAILTPPNLKVKANSVVRFEKQVVEIENFDKMLVTTHRIVTVFNKYGDDDHWNAIEFYNDNQKIKELEARVYDALGKEIKKFKKGDFIDQSAVSGGTLYADDRIKYLSYTPIKYPYTIEFKSEVEYRSTAFVPKWLPIDDYFLAVEHSEYQIINNSSVAVKTKAENFEEFGINKVSNSHVIAKNLMAVKYEAYSPSLLTMVPKYKVALETFDMEGVKGENKDWQGFGKWMYTNLLEGTDQIPQSAINEVKALTDGITDPIDRARIVYEYMQSKTRYISVQIGIGGWKPMLAQDVDKLGYADCKGLTNYTKALLKAVDVPSYYTVVYGGSDITDMDSEFSLTEGNHVILCLPTENENIFLECTSQTNPFGHTAGFTDDRDVLLVTPEGGKIVHTKEYTPEESLQFTKAEVVLDETGAIEGEVQIKTRGYQYSLHENIITKPERDQILQIKEYWDYVNNLNVTGLQFDNNKKTIEFTENVKLSASSYASKSGVRLIFQPNMFNRMEAIPPRYETRMLDFEIDRGYKDVDEFIIHVPEGMKVEAMKDSESLETKFGTYSYRIEQLDGNKLKYNRTYQMNKGRYEKADYEEFRAFRQDIAKLDKSKIILIKN